MDVKQMRAALETAYGGSPKWVARVRSFGDSQVIALYFKFKNEKLIK